MKVIILSGFLVPIVKAFFLFPDLPVVIDNIYNTDCEIDFEIYKWGLQNSTSWAYQMLDACGKAPTGRLMGNMYEFGNFDECLELAAPIRSKYCLVQIIVENIPKPNPPRNANSLIYSPEESILRQLYPINDQTRQNKDSIKIGWCVPISCGSNQLQELANVFLTSTYHPFNEDNITYRAIINDKFCQIESNESYGVLEISFIILTMIITIPVVLATILDYGRRKTLNNGHLIFLNIFSAIRNINELSLAPYDKGLGVLNGIKFVSFMFVLVAHVLTLSIVMPLKNVNFIEDLAKSEPLMLFLNCTLFVDAFFIIAAFLLVYKLHDNKENIYIWIIFRYICLTPSLAYIVFFYIAMLKHIGNGPLWRAIIEPEVEDCRNNWWANLLYINNYINSTNMCMFQTWYVDCDFHFYIIGIIIIFIHNRNKEISKIVGVFALLSSVIISYIYVYIKEVPLLNSVSLGTLATLKSSPEFATVYQTSHNRASPYLIGLVGGYIYLDMRKNNKQFSNLKSNIIFVLSTILLLVAMFSGAYFYHNNHKFNATINAAYISTYRILWASGTVGLILCVNFGNAFLLKNVLSWKPLVPLSKLIYGAYLCHMIFLLRNLGIVKVPFNYDMINMCAALFGYATYSFIGSLLMYIFIEAPVKNSLKFFISTPNSTPVKVGSNN